MCPGRFFGEPTYYGHPDDTDTKAFPFLKRKMFLNSYFFPTFVIVKRKLTPDHNIVKFSTRFTRLGLVLRWIHNTLTMLRCSFIINKRTDDKETSVNVMNWSNFSAWNYYLTYYLTHYFPTSSFLAEITHPFAGADRGSLRRPTDIFVSLSLVIA